MRAKLDMNSGGVTFEQVKTIVDETMVRFPDENEEEIVESEHPHRNNEVEETPEGELPRYDAEKHILLEDAKRIKRDSELGAEMIFPLEPQDDFGRSTIVYWPDVRMEPEPAVPGAGESA